MIDLFEYTNASWVHYDDYEWKKAEDGNLYLLPTKDAKPMPYNPMKSAEDIVLNAAEIGLSLFREDRDENKIRESMREFAIKYGLLGIMTALPTTPKFIQYEKVYFPTNDFIKDESMDTMEYLKLFHPFEMPDFVKRGKESTWENEDHTMIALIMTYQSSPQAMVMSFMRNYGERYDWIARSFKDWTFTLLTTRYFYDTENPPNEDERLVYRKGMAAFEGNAPTYHLELWDDRPRIVWDFHSLLGNIKLMFSLMLTDKSTPLRFCRQCGKPYIAKQVNSEFCSPTCREQHKKDREKRKKK